MNRPWVGLLLAAAAVLCGCGSRHPAAPRDAPAEPAAPGPRIRILGSVQDGGLPHPGCRCSRCEAARRDPARRRCVASLGLWLPSSRKLYLVDATPDIRRQLDALRDLRPGPPGGVDRAPVDGVLLTHAHIGHYLGLAFFGFEALNTRELPVYCTPAMADFLRHNGPWDQLVRLGNVDLREIEPGAAITLEDGVRVTALRVPHRHEYTDTVAFRFDGPHRRILYVPDTDAWASWRPSLPEVLRGVDVAILDGTFYSVGELPGRDLASIGHPLMVRTMELLEPLVSAGGPRVLFTHLNHSNPALDPGAPERRALRERGFEVAEDGETLDL